MQSVYNAHPNSNSSGPTTSHESFYSDSFTKALATSVDSLEYLTFTSSELQNVQLKPKNFARDMEMPTKCLVCGHPTNCCNYGVASCNGCRRFFRRSLLASKTYECKLNGMCSRMHGANRCRACRFDRCILAGMNPRAIQFSASVDVAKLCDKVANRRRYLSQKYGERCPVLIGKTGPVFEETIESKTIQSLVYVEIKIQKIRESSRWLSESVISRSIRELLSNQENVLAHADQYPKEHNWPLSMEEAVKLEASKGRPSWLSLDIFLCIEMARTMPVFSQLDYNDQEALLKDAILTNTILLAAFYSSQMKSETFIMPDGFSPIKNGMFLLPNDVRLKGMMERVQIITCLTMEAMFRIQMTMEEFVLLKAIIYSHSAIHGLSERGRVLLEKESIRYSRTLMKHLQSRMGAAPGAKKYAEIVFFVGGLFHSAQKVRQVHIYEWLYLLMQAHEGLNEDDVGNYADDPQHQKWAEEEAARKAAKKLKPLEEENENPVKAWIVNFIKDYAPDAASQMPSGMLDTSVDPSTGTKIAPVKKLKKDLKGSKVEFWVKKIVQPVFSAVIFDNPYIKPTIDSWLHYEVPRDKVIAPSPDLADARQETKDKYKDKYGREKPKGEFEVASSDDKIKLGQALLDSQTTSYWDTIFLKNMYRGALVAKVALAQAIKEKAMERKPGRNKTFFGKYVVRRQSHLSLQQRIMMEKKATAKSRKKREASAQDRAETQKLVDQFPEYETAEFQDYGRELISMMKEEKETSSLMLMFELVAELVVYGDEGQEKHQGGVDLTIENTLEPLEGKPYSGVMIWTPLVDEGERAEASSIYEKYSRAIPMEYKDIVKQENIKPKTILEQVYGKNVLKPFQATQNSIWFKKPQNGQKGR
ncbi:zinc finger, c4 type (two domains) domain-containing protein [Ditylenchus destructor]|uniref:Zinc finger, c4 type (Two domains) domain-containing protein n=1 Tax=Ditylenchus destructor TaxID=166010 RepID=A0AAD4MWJ4_9BILA|nr:zinc finger, c4 type (two domains) domain-containing protein [Ditylenchus destructor]